MAFQNENTFFHFAQRNAVEEFHRRYEEGLAKVRSQLGKTHALHVGAQSLTGRGTFDDTNPSHTHEVLGKFQKATVDDVKAAIDAAHDAFPKWSALDWKERARIIARAGDLASEHKFELAALCSLENGKNRVEAMYDVDEAIDFLHYYANAMVENHGYAKTLGKPFPNEECTSVLRPYGVWAIIAPFNFPVAIATGMTAGALVTGNTAVLKPSSDTPLTALRMYELLREAGVPAGAVNFVTGSGSTVGSTLVESKKVDGVVFTGSRDVGMNLLHQATRDRPRPCITEMGGKNPIVVTGKADVEKALEGVMKSAFGFNGQKCSAASRLYVHESLHDGFVAKLAEKAKQLKIGYPWEKETYNGPVIHRKAYDDYGTWAEMARDGGNVLTGARQVKDGTMKDGYFVEPTVVTDLGTDHWLFRNELFVPILCTAPYASFDDVLDECNSVEYGLTAGVFSEDKKEVQAFFDRIESGVVYANRKVGGSTGAMVGGQSFGGWKMSGSTGRGAGGPYYLEQFMREQSRTVAH